MTDLEIKKYLDDHNWAINAQDAISNIFNTSPQIIDKKYDYENHIMTISTLENIISFKWILGNL